MVVRIKLLISVGMLAVVGAACGGADGTITASGPARPLSDAASDGPTSSPAGRMSVASLRQAASNATTNTSGRLEMSLRVSEPGGSGELSMLMSGSYTGNRSQISTRAEMTGAASGSMESEFGALADSEVIVIGEDSYVRGGVFSMFAGDSATRDTWLKMPAIGASEMSSVSPDLLEELLDGAYGEVTEVGSADVRGVATTHYQVRLDSDKVLGTAAAGLAPSDLSALDELTMDVFVGADGLMRRMVFAPEIEGVTMAMSVDYFDLGQPVAIDAPTDFTEFDLDTAFGGLAEGFEDLLGELDSAD